MEDWEKVISFLNKNTFVNQALNRVRQLKIKDPKNIKHPRSQWSAVQRQ